jgi:hypothetical protein
VNNLRPADQIKMLQSNSFHGLTHQTSSSSSDSQFVGFLQEKDVSGKVVNSMSRFLVQMMNHLTCQSRQTFVRGSGTHCWKGR